MLKYTEPYIVKSGSAAQSVLNGDTAFSYNTLGVLSVLLKTPNVRLAPSCTDALELSALLLSIQPGDEVIAPSFTLTSTLNAFLLRGATIKFADSEVDSPNISVDSVKELISKHTKALVLVHYAGISCDLDLLMSLCVEHSIAMVEDAAHCIDAYYNDQHLGTVGDIGTISFHQTKNIHCWEGGMIVLKDKRKMPSIAQIANMGTNREDFANGIAQQYNWLGVGSSFRLSPLSAAFLYDQLEALPWVTSHRISLWKQYYTLLSGFEKYFLVPQVPDYAQHNGHIFYLKCRDQKYRDGLIQFLGGHEIQATKHYEALHLTTFGTSIFHQEHIPTNAEQWSNRIIRLPIHHLVKMEDVDRVCDLIHAFSPEND